jgi:hypothetical protein
MFCSQNSGLILCFKRQNATGDNGKNMLIAGASMEENRTFEYTLQEEDSHADMIMVFWDVTSCSMVVKY